MNEPTLVARSFPVCPPNRHVVVDSEVRRERNLGAISVVGMVMMVAVMWMRPTSTRRLTLTTRLEERIVPIGSRRSIPPMDRLESPRESIGGRNNPRV